MKIIIELEDKEDAVMALEHIAVLIEEGYVKGTDPSWYIEE